MIRLDCVRGCFAIRFVYDFIIVHDIRGVLLRAPSFSRFFCNLCIGLQGCNSHTLSTRILFSYRNVLVKG